MAALNSAYIVSNTFMETLATKINVNFEIITNAYLVVDDKQANNHKKLIEEGSRVAHHAPEKIKQLITKSEDLRSRMDDFKKRLDDVIAKNSISKSFNYLCWVGALYCVTILIANGFELNLLVLIPRDAFLFTNIALLTLAILILREEHLRWFNPTYKSIALWFFIVILGVPVIVYFCEHFLSTLKLQNFIVLACKISALVIPVIHFVYFFINSIKVTNRECDKLELENNRFDDECKQQAIEMRGALDALGEISIKE